MTQPNNEVLVTPEFRVSYPRLFKAERNDLNGKDEFSVVALFPKGADLSKLKAAAAAVAKAKWGDTLPSNLRSPFRDQTEKRRTDGTLPAGHEEGAIFINMKSTRKPGVVDPNVQAVMDENEIYGGCYGRAKVTLFAYDQKGNRGVSVGLDHFQKTRDGESFGRERISAEQAFQAVAGGETKSDPNAIFG